MSKEAMELALEALEVFATSYSDGNAAITALREALAEQPSQESEFFTHCVDKPYDWSEWVCPDPKSYLFKCCDCGLVHEAEFGVVSYKSETEREDCDMVDDPNLQAVFRMRRSEQWSPADMAHRAGGLTMEQPAQRPQNCGTSYCSCIECVMEPEQRKPLTDDEIDAFMPAADGSAETDVVSVEVSPGIWGKEYSEVDAWSRPLVFQIARAIEAKLKEKNT